MPDKKYNCVVCHSTSLVSENYIREHAYVKEECCSVHCYNKKHGITPENTQEGTFELTV